MDWSMFNCMRVLFLCGCVGLTGCASYYSHYGNFEAMNSDGVMRHHVIHWKTAEYPEWSFGENESTEITLTTQCSERTWSLSDERLAECPSDGIVACGTPGSDYDAKGLEISQATSVCAQISDESGSKRITDLGHEVLLTVSCRPVSTSYKKADGEIQNTDYLKASVVPYAVRILKVPRYSFRDRMPTFDEKICKDK